MAPNAAALPRPHHDDGLNLRPYVLVFCFFWGLLFGFLIYVRGGAERDTFHDNLNRERIEREQSTRTRPETPVLRMDEREVSATPSVMPVPPDASRERPAEVSIRELLTSRSVGSFRRVWNGSRIPDHARIEMNRHWGLTPQTAPLPANPVRFQPDPHTTRGGAIDHLPPPGSSPRPPVPTPTLGDIEMPELDDF